MTTNLDTLSDKFVPGAATKGAPSRWRGNAKRAILWTAAVTALTLLSWLRLPVLTRETVWAEDGGVFLRDLLHLGKFRSIPIPYDGYLHVLPRTLASIAAVVAPIDAYATMMSLLSCVAVALVAAAVFFLSKSILEPAPLRAMLAVIPVLLPVGPQEILGNVANLHWYLLWLAPWLLLHKPTTLHGRAALFATALATATSEIITALFVPLAVWAIITRKNFWAPLGLILGVALQILTTVLNPRFNSVPSGDGLDPLSVIYGFFLLPVGSIWHADSRTLGSNIVSFGGWALVIPAGLLLTMVVYIVSVGRAALKIAALSALAAAIAVWTASVVLSGNGMFGYVNYTDADWQSGFGYIRYAAAPSMFLLALVPLFFAAAAERQKPSTRMPSNAVLFLFVLVLLASYFPADTTRRLGPSWPAGVAVARSACTSDPALVSGTVMVAPVVWKFAQVQIPCALLTKARTPWR